MPGPRFAALVFASRDQGRVSIVKARDALAATGATVYFCDYGESGDLRLEPAPHPLLDPICAIANFYGFVETVARARGLDPDKPPNLQEVTVTR